jgi:hypothetical protein
MKQLKEYVMENECLVYEQSEFRERYSTETAFQLDGRVVEIVTEYTKQRLQRLQKTQNNDEGDSECE